MLLQEDRISGVAAVDLAVVVVVFIAAAAAVVIGASAIGTTRAQ